MLTITAPNSHKAARAYGVNTVLSDWLGIRFSMQYSDRKTWRIESTNHEGFDIPDDYFPVLSNDGEISSQFNNLFSKIKTSRKQYLKNEYMNDIFGLAYCMLSAAISTPQDGKSDIHNRQTFDNSIFAYNPSILDFPILDEWTEVLWKRLKQKWPNIQRKPREFKMVPTHDIDVPLLYRTQTLTNITKRAAIMMIKRKNLHEAGSIIRQWKNICNGRSPDPADTLDNIMDISEQAGLQSAFFFGEGNSKFDFGAPLNHPLIQNQIKRVHERDHEVGFHPSYRTACHPHIWNNEWNIFRNSIPSEIPIRGGRQHYLRFQSPQTWRCWESAGLEYDSTLTYAQRPGFKCGTCHPFKLFDTQRQETLDLEEHPTILMDCSLMDASYMDLGTTESAYEHAANLISECRKYQGQFVIIWHNTRFVDEKEIELYKWIINQ